MLHIKNTILIFATLTFLNAETPPNVSMLPTHNLLPSIKWIESSEYNLLCFQIYANAKQNFQILDLNTSKHILPFAIIVDIDETILLNLAFRKETMQKKDNFFTKYGINI